jgi:aminomethyltransferase
MSTFAGYYMPLWYKSGARNEHLAVISNCGLFDTSHMSVIIIQGGTARELLQKLTAKDLNACLGKEKNPLEPFRAVYSVYLNEQGHSIDDTIIFQVSKDLFISVVNASMGEIISKHLNNYREDNVEIIDLTDRLGKIDLQGPTSVKTLMKILKNPDKITSLKYFSFTGYFDNKYRGDIEEILTIKNFPIMVSRTGYTGEIGFELFVDIKFAGDLWKLLLEAGLEFGILPCGLASRDSLRVGAMLPLSHQDIGNWPFINNPWSFALPYSDNKKGFTKDFIGAKALLENKSTDFTLPFLGFDVRKVLSGGEAVVNDCEKNLTGRVLTCVTDSAIDRSENNVYSIISPDKPANLTIKGLSCGFIKVDKNMEKGTKVTLEYKGRTIDVEIVDHIRPNLTARVSIKQFI